MHDPSRPDPDMPDPHATFPAGFFRRTDESTDARFYVPDRLVTHIDERAIAAVADLYAELGLTGRVLDIMSSWISHFHEAPAELVALGMNVFELSRNEMATSVDVHDLNADPVLPYPTQVRRCDVLRVGRLPDPTARRVRRPPSCGRAGRVVRVHVLEPVLSDQGRSRVAGERRRRSVRDRRRVLPPHGLG